MIDDQAEVKEWKMILTGILIFAGAFAAFAFNFFILDPLFVPDICYYHNHDFKTNLAFELFYSFPPDEGGHPVPSKFNSIFTLTAGAFLGWRLSNLFFRKKKGLSNLGV
jgi:hypothetical protein